MVPVAATAGGTSPGPGTPVLRRPREGIRGGVARGHRMAVPACGRCVRSVEFEEYDTPETRTENGVAQMPGGGEAAWFKDSEGNLVGVVPA